MATSVTATAAHRSNLGGRGQGYGFYKVSMSFLHGFGKGSIRIL